MRGVRFRFHRTEMTILLTTADTGGAYCLIEMSHPPNVGPARHVHPDGPDGGRLLVTCPKGLEHYFWDVGRSIAGGGLTRDEGFAIVLKYG